ncbi:unnamed protein product [Cuscuta campestris]|uniref:Reverse transcriptase domain-containing protein n=1 Tax=Cuscuta campestris TaxID=132261 RepID=A0A484LYS2_9ASTE|nr:unnamed protein product [Cuscuta campestris]
MGRDPESVPPQPQSTPLHPFAASSSAGMGCTSDAAMAGLTVGLPSLSLVPSQSGVAQVTHELPHVHTSSLSLSPSILVTSGQGSIHGDHTAAIMASQLPMPFSPLVQLSPGAPLVPMSTLMSLQHALNVGNSAFASTAPAPSTPGVCGNVSKGPPNSVTDFLKVKVPLSALTFFNWQEIHGVELKGLVDAEHVIMHVPIASFSQYKQLNILGAVPLALLGPDGAAYGLLGPSPPHVPTAVPSTRELGSLPMHTAHARQGGERGVSFAPTPAEATGKQGSMQSQGALRDAAPKVMTSMAGSAKPSFVQTVAGPSTSGASKSFAQAVAGPSSTDFNVKTESTVAPVWVTFPNLRADLFNESSIHQLCKPIGRCLKVDVATSNFSRPNVAKARVEIDLLKPRIEQIWIGFSDAPGEEDVGMFQPVEYERIPKYCTACFKQGHDNSTCNTLTPSQSDQRTVVVVPQPSMAAPATTRPSRRRRSRSRVRRPREGKGIAIDDAGTSAGSSQREESQYIWREKTAKGSRPIEVVDVDGSGKGEGPSSSLQPFVPTSSHPSPNVVIPDASVAPSTVNATAPTIVVVEQSASQTVEPSVPPIGVEQGSVVASLPLFTSSSSPIVHVPDPQPPELALTMSNTFDALGEMPVDSHEVCGFNTAASSIPSNTVRREDDECTSQTSDGSTGDHFEDPTDLARDLAARGLSPAREAPTTRVVYAKCKYRDREPLWEYLRETHAALPAGMAWGVVGDFNCLLDPSEKKGGRPYAPVKYRPFVECVEDCELVDSPFTGEDYTWFNNRVGGVEIRSRIDRLLFNQPWMDMFSCLVHHLDRVGSDHAPLLVECKSHERPPARPFTFLNVWTEHEDFQRLVADSWREEIAGGPMFIFGAKLKRLALSLKRWNRDTFGHIFDRLKTLEQDKAHAKWVTDRERNLGYFHSVVKDRRRKLYIHRIQDDRGQWVTERAGIALQAITFFQAMFTADPSVTSSVLDMIPRLVTDDDNDRLCAVPEMEEVKTAVFAMDSRSAAGPDGFTGVFYKAAWTIICMDLLAMEMCHGMRVDNEDVILKLDMMKAYDRVSWYFLMTVLRQFGFSETWIDLVYRAISNIWYSVIINGIREGFFHSTRGLQQGDPLSPSLFILSAEVLSLSLAQLYTDPTVARFTQPRDAPHIHHLAYAEDIVIFTSARGTLWREFEQFYIPMSRFQDTIWAAFMRAKYCSRVHPVSKQRVDDDSHTWKRMLDVRAVVDPMIRWRVLSGTSNFWWDTWSSLGALHRQVDGCSGYWTDGVGDMYRSDFMIDHNALPPDLLRQLRLEPPSLVSDHADIPVWTPFTDGKFTLASAKELLRPRWDDEVEDTVLKRRVVPIRWVPPPGGTIKVNVARAPLRGAYAAIVRDSAGKFLYALSSIAFRWDPVERGGMDLIIRCIQWCISQSLLRIHMESHHSELACFFREGTPWYLHDVHARLRFLCSIATVQWFECDLRANGPTTELALWAVDSTEGTREFTNLQDLDIRVGLVLDLAALLGLGYMLHTSWILVFGLLLRLPRLYSGSWALVRAVVGSRRQMGLTVAGLELVTAWAANWAAWIGLICIAWAGF